MSSPISDKEYPIEPRWTLKHALLIVFILIISSSFVFFDRSDKQEDGIIGLEVVSIIFLYLFISTVLRKKAFHYTFQDDFLVLEQGIFSKQKRYLPYLTIQNVFLFQGPLDRIFKLACLIIENAAQGENSLENRKNRNAFQIIGFYNNRVTIPGLSKQNAEFLKVAVLERIKANPVDTSQSGL